MSTLWNLATALRVPLGELLEPPARAVTVVRAAEGATVDGAAVHARLLLRSAGHRSVELYEMRIDPVAQRSRGHLPGVEEWVLVTSGGLVCGPADDPVTLRAGDSARYDASVPHTYQGLDSDSKAVLAMIHGESGAVRPRA